MSSKSDPFALIREAGTSSETHGLTTDEIISRLEEWKEFCDFEVVDAEPDSVTLKFKKLPDDLENFAEEVYDFAPDVIEQDYGDFDDDLDDETEDEAGERDEEEDLDPDDPDFGLKLLVSSLRREKRLQLWWD